MKNFFIRTITGAVLVLLVSLGVFSKSRMLLFILIELLSASCLWELFQATEPDEEKWHLFWAEGSCLFLNLAGYYRETTLLLAVWLISLMVLFVMSFREFPGEMKVIEQPLFIVVYIVFSWTFAYFYPPGRQNYLAFPFAIAWGTDTMAYLTGSWIGKRPLTKISPKKTVEGSIGGILGSILLCLFFRQRLFPEFSIGFLVLFAICGSVLAQIGDIFASSIKRRSEIKDFGKILRGHGGIMDRFDSVLFTIPYVWLYFFVFFP